MKFMPELTSEASAERYRAIQDLINSEQWQEGIDSGDIAGIDKPTLLQSGAQKLAILFGLVPRFDILEKTEDWDKPLFYYQVQCTLTKDGEFAGQADGSANSWEQRHRYRWVAESLLPEGFDKENAPMRTSTMAEPDFAIAKRETAGKYGKPVEHWDEFEKAIREKNYRTYKIPNRKGDMMVMVEVSTVEYRISNPNLFDMVNTLLKMAQKRAFVYAVLQATGMAGEMTQDVEDLEELSGEKKIEKKPEQKQEKAPPVEPEQKQKKELVRAEGELWTDEQIAAFNRALEGQKRMYRVDDAKAQEIVNELCPNGIAQAGVAVGTLLENVAQVMKELGQ